MMVHNSIEVSWNEIKDFVDSRNVSLQWLDVGKSYILRAFDGAFSVSCTLRKISTTEVTDFEANYKNQGKDNRHPTSQVTQTLAEDDLTLRAQGEKFTATNSSTSQHLYPCDLAYALNGGEFFASNAELGDSIKIDIYDKDNVLGYGTDFALPGSGFVGPDSKKWMIMPGTMQQIVDLSVSHLPAPGLYIRVCYTSVGATDVDFVINLRLYEVIT